MPRIKNVSSTTTGFQGFKQRKGVVIRSRVELFSNKVGSKTTRLKAGRVVLLIPGTNNINFFIQQYVTLTVDVIISVAYFKS